MSVAALFPRRLLIAWIGAALLTFAAALYFMGGGGRESGGDAVGPSTFSRSAIGYAGIAEILRRLGTPWSRASTTRWQSSRRAASSSSRSRRRTRSRARRRRRCCRRARRC